MDSQHSTKRNGTKTLNKKKKRLVTLGAFIGFIATLFYPTEKSPDYIGASLLSTNLIENEQLGEFPILTPTVKYGFALDTFLVDEGKIKRNQTLNLLLTEIGLETAAIEAIVKSCDGVFNLNRNFQAGKTYTLLTRTPGEKPDHLILEPNVYEYFVFDLKNVPGVKKVAREVQTRTVSVAGEIESSLWEALTKQGVGPEAAAKMEDALQWSVDFSHTQGGDEFKLVYDENFIGEKAVGSGQVYAAYYKREGKEYYAFWFDNGEQKGYYDLEGRPGKKGFLKAPVKFTRISSNFNLRRFHPVLKYVRPHLGTDYAAPYGTPIYAVGDGVVEEAAFTKGNGKYVKIKHDKVYQTQYLHMSRFAKGIRRGAPVAQGQVIGYVGSTGLATGPHVCFRFWKNGKQVNHLRQELPQAKQLPKETLHEFYKVRDQYLGMMKGEPFQQAGKVYNVIKDSLECEDDSAP